MSEDQWERLKYQAKRKAWAFAWSLVLGASAAGIALAFDVAEAARVTVGSDRIRWWVLTLAILAVSTAGLWESGIRLFRYLREEIADMHAHIDRIKRGEE